MVNAVNPDQNSHMQLLAAALSHIENLRLRSVLRQQTTVKTHSPAKKISPSGYSNLGAGGAEGYCSQTVDSGILPISFEPFFLSLNSDFKFPEQAKPPNISTFHYFVIIQHKW